MIELQSAVTDAIRRSRPFHRLADILQTATPSKSAAVRGLRGSSLAALVCALTRPGGPRAFPAVLVVTANHERSAEILDDLQFFGAGRALHFPQSEVLPYDEDKPLLEEQIKHLEVIHGLAAITPGQPDPLIVATSIEALFQRVAPPSVLASLRATVRWGEPFNPEEFASHVAELGYQRVSTVEARGEFAIRGGIVDIYPVTSEQPIRIDLFGTEIESMRWFEVQTQRSIKSGDTIEEISILPASIDVSVSRSLEQRAGLVTLLDLLPEGSLLVLDGAESYPVRDEHFQQLLARQFANHGAGKTPPEQLYTDLKAVEKAAKRLLRLHHTLVVETPGSRSVSFESSSFETVKPSLEHYVTQFRRRLGDGYTCVLVCDNDGQAMRMDEMLRENELGSSIYATGPKDQRKLPPKGPAGNFADVVVTVGDMHTGFVLSDAGLYVVTDREIFGRYKRRPVYRKIYKGVAIADPREIRAGDYVVHLDHGVGRFEGIRTQNMDGRSVDFLELIYAGDAKLLVPVEKIAYVHKYSGPDQAVPSLDSLGSKKWLQRRKKSREEVERLAQQLLELYAKRSLARGHSFEGDTPWQREFEASFLYTETPDQLKAIQEVKADMMGEKPMDRLVCGDVGYGKTEVAIRAAFKAIQGHRQVAVLAPTTILAQQHYNTFRERFADYPIKVEVLSRFRTPTEARLVTGALKRGEVDLVVGTHALLAKSVEFKNLGLVIVDEEQRFGVAQKERLKEMRASVDILTLTATPIPRTLYMALSGLRDMSLISTPPADRHPVKTRVIHWDRDQIEESILRELNRGGQVFFVHNRVQSIHQVADRVKEIVPTARVAIAHGQMDDEELEQVMIDFIDGKHDILLSTTIIENGVDIPNVNTIIINRADAFGLAQLYQLRGRVGRQTRQAYAYLIVPAGQGITEQAVARLAAIQEFTELGVGFNIAMRDMEIRGAGNLLGKEQHGSMAAVGFEMYCRMLEEAVEEARGRFMEEQQRPDVEIQWKLDAHVPSSYVPVESQRVLLYKRLADARTLEELDAIADEVRDRYGEIARTIPATKKGESPKVVEDIPVPVANLIDVARLRILGRGAGLARIVATASGFKWVRPDAVRELGPSVAKTLKTGGPKVYTDEPGMLEFHFEDWRHRQGLRECVDLLKRATG